MNKYLLKIAELEEGSPKKTPFQNTVTAVAANAPADIAGSWAGAKGADLIAKSKFGQSMAGGRAASLVGKLGGHTTLGAVTGGLVTGAAATYAAFKHRDKK